MKKFFTLGLLCISLGIIYLYKNDITRVYKKTFINKSTKVTLDKKNKYYKNESFNYVQITNDFTPKNKQDLYNIYYTAINAGKKEFTFYCNEEYKDCLNEVKYLANNQLTLSNINNYVNPFNGFKHIETTYDTAGKVTINVYHTYQTEDIEAVRTKINEIESNFKDDSLSTIDQIRKYHDYIIDNTVYDSARSDKGEANYKSDTAYGSLIQGYSLCGGYTDAMALILDDMGVTNYKVSTDNHIWNAVKLNNKWYHLDLTWDDPVTNDGTNLIEHDFFLISTEELKKIEPLEHNFDEEVFSELKQN